MNAIVADTVKHLSFGNKEHPFKGVFDGQNHTVKGLNYENKVLDPERDTGFFAETDGEPHNTITPIARMRDGKYQLDLVLRNNITTPEHPLGVYHPHAKLHHIKKENIGLIEVMGLAVLPSRLKAEMADVEAALAARTPAAEYGESIQKHAEWAMDILARHPELNAENVHSIVQDLSLIHI